MGPEIAISAASGLAQAYVTEKARGAAKEKLDEMEDMFNSIVPPQYNISIFDDPKMLAGVPPAAFNTAAITPEAYKVVEKYSPESAAFIKEQNPKLAQASEAGQKGREAQLEALQKYRDISSENGFDPSMMDKYNLASQKAQAAAQSQNQSVLQNAARRGQSGAGSTLAAQLQGGSDAMQRQAQMSSDMAGQAYQNQLEAMRQQASLGGNLRASDMNESKSNADIINSFNQRATGRYQDYLNQQADARNQANLRNANVAQDVGNKNVSARNTAQEANLRSQNDLAQKQFENNRQQYQDRLGITKDKNAALAGQFQGQMTQANAKAGVYRDKAAMETQTGRDRAQQIQGISDIGRDAYSQSQEEE